MYVVKKVDDEYGQYKTHIDMEGQFFDEKFMEQAELSWLKKPENVRDEIFLEEDHLYTYVCALSSSEEATAYANYIFSKFHELGYYFGGQKTVLDVTMDLFKVYVVKPFLTLEEYKDKAGQYVLYYSKKGLTWMDAYDKMNIIEAKKLIINIIQLESDYQLALTLDTDIPPVLVDSEKPPYDRARTN